MGASGPPSSASGGGGEGKISSSRGAGGKDSSIGGGGGGKAPPRVSSVSSPSPRRGGGGKGRSGIGRRKRAVSRRPSSPFSKFPSFHSPNPSPKNSQGSRGVREGNGGAWGLRAGVVQLPLHFGKRTRRQDSCPTFPPPTPRRGLGPVPGALAPSHELRDEVRTSARDRVAAPSPLRGNLSKHPQPLRHCPQRGARPGPAPSPAAYLPGAAAGSRPPGPSVRAGPRRPAEARCPRAGKDSLWASEPPPGRTSSAGRKKPAPRPRPRSRETGGGPPWPGRAAGRGGPGYAAPSLAEDAPGGRAPRGVPAASPRALPASGSRLLTAGRSVRAASQWPPGRRVRGLCAPVPSRLYPGGGGTRSRGWREGRGERGAQTIQGAAPRGGRGEREGRRGRKLPQEGAQVLPLGHSLRQGPPAPAPAPAPAARPAEDHPSPCTSL